jgi:hypothetical protein
LRVRDPHLASGPQRGVACDDEDGESGAVHERNAGQVDLDAVGKLRGQDAAQSIVEHVGGCQVDRSDHGDPNDGWRRATRINAQRHQWGHR